MKILHLIQKLQNCGVEIYPRQFFKLYNYYKIEEPHLFHVTSGRVEKFHKVLESEKDCHIAHLFRLKDVENVAAKILLILTHPKQINRLGKNEKEAIKRFEIKNVACPLEAPVNSIF